MSPADREQFREHLVALLAAAGATGRKPAAMLVTAVGAGHEIDARALADELDYLAGKGLVAPVDKLLSPENPRWKITAAGRDYAALHGLG